MEGQPFDYYGNPRRTPPAPGQDINQGHFNTPHGFHNYPTEATFAPFQGQRMPFPSQLVPMVPSNAPYQAAKPYYGQEQRSKHVEAMSSSIPSNSTVGQNEGYPSVEPEPYIQEYGAFQRGYTIPDPASVESDGRTYQNYRPDKYFMPNDAIEQDRLDFTHRGFCLQVQALTDPRQRPSNPEDALHLAPIVGDPKRVLDIGCGTGVWTIAYARAHPMSQVIGSDLSLVQPNMSASVPNVSFVREDAEDEWVYDEPFDFIHSRLMFSCYLDHRAVIRKAYDNLVPGGWIEYQDSSYNIDSDDNSHRGTALHKWSYLALAGAAAKGRDFEVSRKYKQYFLEAGFVDVVEVPYKLPGNTWPETEPQRTLGHFMIVSGAEVVKTVSKKLLGDGLGLPNQIVKDIVSRAQKDMFDRNIHYYWPGYIVYARKPFHHETTGPTS